MQTSEGARKAAKTRRKNYTAEQIAEQSRKGGRAKTLGGFGWLKKNDPERFRQIIADRDARRRAKTATK